MTTVSTGGLALTGVTKRFPGVTALDSVSFTAKAGEIHALIGGNGAGKSTLMAIASGALVADEGALTIDGAPIVSGSPMAVREQGLAIAYQHPAILPDLTVAENLVLAVPPALRPDPAGAHPWAEQVLAPMGMNIDPSAPAGSVGLAEKQAIEICGALASNPRVLILDEPTEPFAATETETLFRLIRSLAESGVAVVYISHRLPDVFALADRMTVLRDGRKRGEFAAGEVTEGEIVTLIAGRTIDALFPPRADDIGGVAVEIEGLSAGLLSGATTRVHRREILGLAGVEGNGQREFIRALGGANAAGGSVRVGATTVDLSEPRTARAAGIVLMPQERHIEGIAPALSVRENLSVAAPGRVSRGGIVSAAAEREFAGAQVRALGVKTATIETPLEHLSGGNQQKVVLGRSLLSEPHVLLCDEPTQGIDVGNRSDIYHRLRDTADNGIPVVVSSSDNVELAGLCDRVLVFSHGRIVEELTGDALTEHTITEASLTAGRGDGPVATGVDAAAGRGSRFRRFIASQQAPSLVLIVAALVLATVSSTQSERFLSAFNIGSMLALLAPILFIAAGQLVVMLTGGIDLSVGPLAGTLVVVASFFVVEGYGWGWWVLGFLAMVVLALAVGLLNGSMIRFARVSPVVATLITYTALQGLSLVLRDAPGGIIALDVVDVLNTRVGPIPVAVLVGAALLVSLEYLSRRSSLGLRLRGAGSDDSAAHYRGIPVGRVQSLAYIASSVLTAFGALLLMSQIGVGDPTAGLTYTLTSITAVVLGGASIFGGRGSFVGVLFGVLFLQLIENSTIFLGLSQAWQYLFVGMIALAATALYAQVQQRTAR
ncbi:ATP-binding cassette domain-containing protein [Nocardia sp. NPDC001965]